MAMRTVIWIIIAVITIIIILEVFISSDIERQRKLDKNKSEKNIISITSYIKSGMIHKEWMKIFNENIDKNKIINECNEENWMNGLYEIFEPLMTWKYYDNISIVINSNILKNNNNNNKYIMNDTLILIMDKYLDINHEKDYDINDLSTFKQWRILNDSSLLIRRIFNIDDINLFGRFIEYLWAKNWMGHIRNDPNCTPKNDHCRDTHLFPVRIESVSCWKCGCILEKQTRNILKWKKIIENNIFFKIANKTNTDKILYHSYHKLYSKYLLNYYYLNKGIFLEIGLGCNMIYGPGHSAKIWIQLFNNVEFIEYDKNCTNKYMKQIINDGYNVNIGSQDDLIFLEQLKQSKKWINLGIDIIIDDGGHFNKQIIASFLSLWPYLNNNGLYFIEDFQESAYIKNYVDSKPITFWGKEKPGTAQYFIKKQLLYHLFCKITKKSCFDLNYIQCIRDLCMFKKKIILN